jgi:hypothetical protein
MKTLSTIQLNLTGKYGIEFRVLLITYRYIKPVVLLITYRYIKPVVLLITYRYIKPVVLLITYRYIKPLVPLLLRQPQLHFLKETKYYQRNKTKKDRNNSLFFSSESDFRRQYFKEEQLSLIKYLVLILRYLTAVAQFRNNLIPAAYDPA